MKFGAIYINDSRKYIPGVEDPREELASGREGEERHEGGLDGEDDEAGVDQPQVEVHPDGLAHQLGLAQDGQALRDRALPGGGSQAANTGPAAGERKVEEPLPEGGVRLLGDLPAAVAVRVQVVHHLPHVGVDVPEKLEGKLDFILLIYMVTHLLAKLGSRLFHPLSVMEKDHPTIW